MVDNQGNVYNMEDLIATSGVEYFKEVFSTSKLTIPITNSNVIPNLVAKEDNLLFIQPPTEDEIWNIIKDMNGDSVAGPDGFTTKFFVRTWDIIKKDVVGPMHDFFKANHFGMLTKSSNMGKLDRIVRWLKPSALCVKLNTDGSFGATNAGIYNVNIEVDSKLVIHVISDNYTGFPQDFYTIRKIKMALPRLNFTISHIYHEGNACADWLANFGAQSEVFQEHPMNNLLIPLRSMITLDKIGLPYIRLG
ncbi:hypothetical protein KFK09_001905 [Dendrobium nobile]|uniref:RNase H type-1 domain-containing protein n=1 Tax=Dendrobium nobile TaxID=94219 RepID=A0A8T3C8R4_DENNO|nr:hypothetical protein KFK09_001905 [Dendrobium nobile]